jgi:hypothetical protein
MFMFVIFGFFCLLSVAQNLKATLGQVNQLQVKLENQKADKCNIDVAFPNGGTAQFDVSKPDYIANIAFNPSSEGPNTITWQGNLRRRGLSSLTGCEGSGRVNVYVTPTNEVKAQRWTELASKISDKQKTCISTGLNLINGNLDFKAISGEINVDVNEPAVKNIRGRCENFADVVLQKNQTCKINEKQSLCDESFEIIINGETKRFNEDELLKNVFKKEQIQKVTFENDQGKNKREIAEAEEAKKLEAYKKTPAYKKEQAELAKKQAMEEARIKKEQAENEKRRLREEAIAKKAAEEEAKQKIANMKEFIYRKPNSPENTVSEEVFLDVCKKTNYWHMGDYGNEIVRTVVGYALFDSNAENLINSGGADIKLKDIYVSKGNQCYLNFSVQGIYKGTSVNLNAFCSVTRIIKMNNGEFKAMDYFEGSTCSKQ